MSPSIFSQASVADLARRQRRTSIPHVARILLQVGDGDETVVEDGCGERAACARFERVAEMFGRTGAARGDYRHGNRFDNVARVGNVVARAHTVVAHAVEHDLARAARGRFAHPFAACAIPLSRVAVDTAGILLDPISRVRRKGCRHRARRIGCRSHARARRSAQARSIAGELIEILSAPAPRQAAAWSRVRTPPATANGMSITRAMRRTHSSVERPRPPALAVMS